MRITGRHHTNNEKDTFTLGTQVAKRLKGGEVIGLSGELGSGKTILAKGIARGLGIKEVVLSPTFVLRREYVVKHKTIRQLIHIDLYRLQSKDNEPHEFLEDSGEKNFVTAIEWPEKISFNALRGTLYLVSFTIQDKDKRTIDVKKI